MTWEYCHVPWVRYKGMNLRKILPKIAYHLGQLLKWFLFYFLWDQLLHK